MHKKKRLLYCPFAYYDAECLQSWLQNCAKQGLFLSKNGFIGPFAIMEYKPKADCCYQLLPVIHRTSDDQELYQMIERAGWKHITDYRNSMAIYYTDQNNPQLFHSDPEIQVMEIQKAKRLSLLYIIYIVILALIPIAGTVYFETAAYVWTEGKFYLIFEAFLFFLLLMIRWIHFTRWQQRLLNDTNTDEFFLKQTALNQTFYRLSIIGILIILTVMAISFNIQ